MQEMLKNGGRLRRFEICGGKDQVVAGVKPVPELRIRGEGLQTRENDQGRKIVQALVIIFSGALRVLKINMSKFRSPAATE